MRFLVHPRQSPRPIMRWADPGDPRVKSHLTGAAMQTEPRWPASVRRGRSQAQRASRPPTVLTLAGAGAATAAVPEAHCAMLPLSTAAHHGRAAQRSSRSRAEAPERTTANVPQSASTFPQSTKCAAAKASNPAALINSPVLRPRLRDWPTSLFPRTPTALPSAPPPLPPPQSRRTRAGASRLMWPASRSFTAPPARPAAPLPSSTTYAPALARPITTSSLGWRAGPVTSAQQPDKADALTGPSKPLQVAHGSAPTQGSARLRCAGPRNPA